MRSLKVQRVRALSFPFALARASRARAPELTQPDAIEISPVCVCTRSLNRVLAHPPSHFLSPAQPPQSDRPTRRRAAAAESTSSPHFSLTSRAWIFKVAEADVIGELGSRDWVACDCREREINQARHARGTLESEFRSRRHTRTARAHRGSAGERLEPAGTSRMNSDSLRDSRTSSLSPLLSENCTCHHIMIVIQVVCACSCLCCCAQSVSRYPPPSDGIHHADDDVLRSIRYPRDSIW